jgi:hypothetical protein
VKRQGILDPKKVRMYVKMVYLTLKVKMKRFNAEFGVTAMATAGVRLHQTKVSNN